WIPEFGRDRELDWLRNMGDWMISKKRYWGLALPIWVDDETGEFEVIGSREELKARAVEGWDQFEGHSPHRPWIDKVKLRNPRTGNLMSRIPDVGNPWLDAGIVPFSTLGYRTNPDYWRQWFPADEIRNKFVLKLWNTYAFFCNYARLDDFDPAAPPVPIAERPDIDRWILSDLQLLIRKARQSFESFNVMAFCLEAEQFVDDRL